MNDLTVTAGTVMAERTYGTLTLSLVTAKGGFTVAARSGMIRHDELTKGFADKSGAREFWGRVAYLALAQMSAAQIVEKMAADQPAAHTAAPAETPSARIADLYGTRQAQVRPTMAGAHLADLTGPQLAALTAHRDGVVHLQPGISRPTLKALARKGLGVLLHEAGMGRRKVIEAIRLNQRGLNAVVA